MKVERFGIARHQVSRRIVRMNKRLEKEFGECAAEKRVWHWALTNFALEVWEKMMSILRFSAGHSSDAKFYM